MCFALIALASLPAAVAVADATGALAAGPSTARGVRVVGRAPPHGASN